MSEGARMETRVKARRLPGLLFGAVCLAAACGRPGADPAADAGATAGDTAAATTPAGVVDTAAAGSADDVPGPGEAAADRATALPALPGEGEPRLYRLLIVNRRPESIHVHASAGAGRVVLDTVPGRDSTRVDIRVRADHIRLEAEEAAGSSVAGIELDLRAEALNRWEIAAGGS